MMDDRLFYSQQLELIKQLQGAVRGTDAASAAVYPAIESSIRMVSLLGGDGVGLAAVLVLWCFSRKVKLLRFFHWGVQ